MKTNNSNTESYKPTENLRGTAGRYLEEAYRTATKEIERRLKRVNRNAEFPEYAEIKETDGIPEVQEAACTSGEEKTEKRMTRRKKTEKGAKSFNNDDEETRKKKIKSMEEFYSSPKQVQGVESLLSAIFSEVFAGTEIDETAEDEIQNAAEAYLTKRSWDVDKHPDYRKQLLYTIKYNLIPNMLNKYYGLRLKNLSDEELQERNFTGAGLRGRPTEKNSFTREDLGDFDISEEEGTVIYNTEGKEGYMHIERTAYTTPKERHEEERVQREFEQKRKRADRRIYKCKDEKVKMLWKLLKKENDYTRVNVEMARKLNMTMNEVRALRKRLLRVLGVRG